MLIQINLTRAHAVERLGHVVWADLSELVHRPEPRTPGKNATLISPDRTNLGFKPDDDVAAVEMTEIVRNPEHSNGAPTIEGTGIRVIDIAKAYEHSGYSPDEIVDLYPDLSLTDIHTALAFYYDNIDEFRSASSPPASV